MISLSFEVIDVECWEISRLYFSYNLDVVIMENTSCDLKIASCSWNELIKVSLLANCVWRSRMAASFTSDFDNGTSTAGTDVS